MGLQENLSADKVEKLNLREAITLGTTATVRDAVEKMRAARLGCVLITDESGKAVGEFTEAMLRSRLHEGTEVLDTALGECMAKTFAWVTPDDPVEMVLDAMETRNTRFIAVLDADQKVVGLTGQKGLMEYVAEHFPHEVMVQYVGPTPHSTSREGA